MFELGEKPNRRWDYPIRLIIILRRYNISLTGVKGTVPYILFMIGEENIHFKTFPVLDESFIILNKQY